VAFLIRFFAEGKFYTMFSFLFGLGLFLQMSRAEARGVRFVPIYIRRLIVLLGIGLIHAIFIWSGDILVLYAVLGFPLLLFRHQSTRALLTWAIIVWSIPILLTTTNVALVEAARSSPQAAADINRSFAQSAAENRAALEQAMAVYARGNFGEITQQRLRDLGFQYSAVVFAAPPVFAMFLLGLYAGRRGIFGDIPAHAPLLRRVRTWGLILGMTGNLLYALGSEASRRGRLDMGTLAIVGGQAVGSVALCLFYIAALTLLLQDLRWQGRLGRLAPVGRMALTNYLLESLICTMIFNGYGLGLYGRVGPAAGLLLSVVIYLLLIPFSGWWLHRFRFGPVEWIWRTLTYLRPQPMRLGAGGPAE